MGPFDSDIICVAHVQWYKYKHVSVILSEKSYENYFALCWLSFKIVVFLYISIEKPFKSLFSLHHCLQKLLRGFHAFPMQFSVSLEQNLTQICCSFKSYKANCGLCKMFTTINTHWGAVQRDMAAKLTRLTWKVGSLSHLVSEHCTTCCLRNVSK